MAEMIDLLSQCRPYIEPHGDADSRRLLREIDAALAREIPKRVAELNRKVSSCQREIDTCGQDGCKWCAEARADMARHSAELAHLNTHDSIDSEYVEEGHDV